MTIISESVVERLFFFNKSNTFFIKNKNIEKGGIKKKNFSTVKSIFLFLSTPTSDITQIKITFFWRTKNLFFNHVII